VVHGVRAFLPHLIARGGGIEGGGVDVGEHDRQSVSGEAVGEGQTDATAGAGDDGDLTGFELHADPPVSVAPESRISSDRP
jgi:hypothetical protein